MGEFGAGDEGIVKRPVIYRVLGLCFLGLLLGFAARRAAHTEGAAESVSGKGSEGERGSRSEAKSMGRTRKGAGGVVLAPSSLRSSDTLEDVIALKDEEIYGRLALWLMDAGEEEVASYWAHHLDREGRSRAVTDLVMINWTRLNPQGATAAVEGTRYAEFAWWAWASHDPEGALAAGIAKSPDRMNNVSWGLGEFHPEWLRENFDRIPERARGNALMGLMKWGEVDDAMATMEFLKDKGRSPSKGLLRNFVKQDPWAAYEWFKEQGTDTDTNYGRAGDRSMDLLMTTLADTHPDVLMRIIEQEPSGARKRGMEKAAFESLLKIDPIAALEQAEGTRAPEVAAERMAAVGLRLARTDPEEAFRIAEQLFITNPNAMRAVVRVEYPSGGESSFGGSGGDASALVDSLIARDPARLMELSFDSVDAAGRSRDSVRNQIGEKWAERDVQGYAQWVLDQEDPNLVERSAQTIVSQLRNMERYDEALDWAASMESGRTSYVSNLLQNWEQMDPGRALQWLESSTLPAEEVEKYRTRLEKQ